MAIELECTVRVASLEAVREKLRAAGAEYMVRVLEDNKLFDSLDGSLRKADCGLRIRSASVMEGLDQAPTLTYKGPRTDCAFKSRRELEVAISDAATAAQLLRALGYSESVVYEKRRESWSLSGCRIELDELPALGVFVEVEGPNEPAIREVLATLNSRAAKKSNRATLRWSPSKLRTGQPGQSYFVLRIRSAKSFRRPRWGLRIASSVAPGLVALRPGLYSVAAPRLNMAGAGRLESGEQDDFAPYC